MESHITYIIKDGRKITRQSQEFRDFLEARPTREQEMADRAADNVARELYYGSTLEELAELLLTNFDDNRQRREEYLRTFKASGKIIKLAQDL